MSHKFLWYFHINRGSGERKAEARCAREEYSRASDYVRRRTRSGHRCRRKGARRVISAYAVMVICIFSYSCVSAPTRPLIAPIDFDGTCALVSSSEWADARTLSSEFASWFVLLRSTSTARAINRKDDALHDAFIYFYFILFYWNPARLYKECYRVCWQFEILAHWKYIPRIIDIKFKIQYYW